MAELEEQLNQPSESEKRVKESVEKTRVALEERDKERSDREAAEAKAAEAERKATFYQGFSDVVAENPAAKDHKDEIEAKVMGGYTVQDATYAVLGAAGKLNQQPEAQSPAGGSAGTVIPSNGVKSVQEMTQEERRAQLVEAEARGDIGVN